MPGATFGLNLCRFDTVHAQKRWTGMAKAMRAKGLFHLSFIVQSPGFSKATWSTNINTWLSNLTGTGSLPSNKKSASRHVWAKSGLWLCLALASCIAGYGRGCQDEHHQLHLPRQAENLCVCVCVTCWVSKYHQAKCVIETTTSLHPKRRLESQLM